MRNSNTPLKQVFKRFQKVSLLSFLTFNLSFAHIHTHTLSCLNEVKLILFYRFCAVNSSSQQNPTHIEDEDDEDVRLAIAMSQSQSQPQLQPQSQSQLQPQPQFQSSLQSQFQCQSDTQLPSAPLEEEEESHNLTNLIIRLPGMLYFSFHSFLLFSFIHIL